MIIKKIRISAFGPIIDRTFEFDDGLNVITGPNEAGKTSLAMFIKFILYGLSARDRDGSGVDEKTKYVNWEKSTAAGTMFVSAGYEGAEREIRIDRILTLSDVSDDGKAKYSEKLAMTDASTGEKLAVKGSVGETLLGVSEAVFLSSACMMQGVNAKPDESTIRESIENLMSSGDEKADLKGAADRLDKERIKYRHKNRTGGDIPTLEEEEYSLRRQIEDGASDAKRLVTEEISLADTKRMLDESEKRRDEIDGIFKAGEIIRKNEKLNDISSRKKNLEEMKASLASLKEEGIDEEFSSKLKTLLYDRDRIGKNISSAEEKIKKAEKDIDEAEPEWSSYEGSPTERVDRYSRKSTVSFALSVIFIIVGIALVVCSVLLKEYLPFDADYCLYASAGVVLIGIISAIRCISLKKKIKSIFREWGAEDYDSLEESIETNSTAARLGGALELLKTTMDEFLSEKEKNSQEFLSLAEKAGIADASDMPQDELIRKLIASAEAKIAERKDLEGKIARAEGNIAGLEKDIGSSDGEDEISEEALKIAESLSEDDLKRLDTERRFLLGKIQSLREKELELERSVASLGAVSEAPAVLFERHEEIKELLRKKNEEYDALLLALEALTEAGEKLRAGIVPKMMKKASSMMENVTTGRYDSLLSKSGSEITFFDESTGPHDIGSLSGGTRILAYIAFRIAFIDTVCDGAEKPVVLMDDILSEIDEDREERCLGLLADSGLQTLLFSCRNASSDTENVNYIRM